MLPAFYLLAETGYINYSMGVFDLARPKYRTGEARLEYQAAVSWYWIHPIIGVFQSFKGATYVYGGLCLDANWKNFLLVPSIAAGYYNHGGGKKMGCPLEFRSALLLGYQRPDRFRMGLQISHVSNAGLGSKNPGEETMCLVLGFPINWKKEKIYD